ncbi:MAG: RNA polymerase sigma factor [Planctomycetes bacterium]|nr:RNA polymerase sigma factor [Planctomycetota bacterium]
MTRDDQGEAGGSRVHLLEEHLAALRVYVRNRLGERLRAKETSQDLVQSICRDVLTDLDGFQDRGGSSFRDWLLRTAENKIVDKVRFWGRERRASDREVSLQAAQGDSTDDARLLAQIYSLATPSQAAVAREELERLERAFRELPEDYRTAIVLSRVHGLSGADIAAKLGRSEGATRTLLSRALARLALVMEGDENS